MKNCSVDVTFPANVLQSCLNVSNFANTSALILLSRVCKVQQQKTTAKLIRSWPLAKNVQYWFRLNSLRRAPIPSHTNRLATTTMIQRTRYVASFHLDGARPTNDAGDGTLAFQAHCRERNAGHWVHRATSRSARVTSSEQVRVGNPTRLAESFYVPE